MRTQLVAILFISFLFPTIGSSQTVFKRVTEDEIKQPPPTFEYSQIETWINEAIKRIRPNMHPKIMQTSEWSNYMNFEHFVPLGSDPHIYLQDDDLEAELQRDDNAVEEVPTKDVHYDYNWNTATYATQDVPTAEVTETGEFNFWWNRCNYRKYDEAKCKWIINLIVSHEAHHFDQWRFIALQSLNRLHASLKTTDGAVQMPSSLQELDSVPGAKEEFLKTWSDVAHYQCREVEVYSQQLANGEFPRDAYAERVAYMKWYARRCRNSKWAAEFKQDLDRSDAIVTWWKQGNRK